MDIFNTLEENSILIIPNALKKKVLKYFNDFKILKSIKIMSFKDLKIGLMFDYTNEAINFVMKKYDVSYEVAREYLNSLYYLNDEIKNEKYDLLNEIYNSLKENNLLITDNLFGDFLKSKSKIYVYGFDFLESFNKHLLDLAKSYIDVDIIDKKYNKYKHDVLNCNSITLEIKYVAEEISKLIDKGVDINKIYIANYSNEYRFTIKYIFDKYNLPIYLKNDDSLYSSVIGGYFLDNLEENKDRLLYKLEKKFDAKNNVNNSLIINKIFNLINKYYWCENLCDVKQLLIEEMKNIKLNDNHMSNEITTTSIINNVFDDDEYVFLIGFNDSSIPKVKKDDAFISDDIKPSFVDTTTQFNKMVKDATIKAISSIKNLVITYKLSSSKSTYLPSYLIKNDLLTVKKIDNFISHYSDKINELYEAECLDNLSKYNVLDENLSILLNNYQIPYKTYNNDFTGIENSKLLNHLEGNVNISYSALNNYHECPFKFYLSNVLKISEYEQKFDAFVGSLFHKCLENVLDGDMELDQVYDNYINDNWSSPTNGEKFFLELLKDEVKVVIDIIKDQYGHSKHTEVLVEDKQEFTIDSKIKFTIKGYVDKLMLFNDEAIIVDYKTGSKEIDKEKFKYGLDLQLPIYLYLLKTTKPDVKICGFYIQHILNSTKKYDGKDLMEKRKSKMKLTGYTLDYDIANFDDTYESSTIINGLKVKDGEINPKYYFDEKAQDDLIKLIEDKVNNSIKNIEDGVFNVSPLYLDKNIGCQFCDYKDICFRKPNNINYQIFESDGDDYE